MVTPPRLPTLSAASALYWEPRRRPNADIRLLRLELIPRGKSPTDELDMTWSPAQPTENLSPEKAAASLGIEVWLPQSLVQKRYRLLQTRYPPDQFMDRHIEWRPSAELLGSPRNRLNWFWQSGLIPLFCSEASPDQCALWNASVAEAITTPLSAFQAMAGALEHGLL